MPEPFASRLSTAAALISDGMPVDWATLESDATNPDERLLLQRLRVVADVAGLHSSGSFAESLLTSAGKGWPRDGRRPTLPLGTVWGHLKILDCVGRGRYGVVYRAWDARLERAVALKLLDHDPVTGDGSEVIHEGRLMARLHHPNVVAIYGAEARDGQVGLWMQFVEGRTLEAELAATGPLAESELQRIARQLCEALRAVHQAGLLHRDVKPQNVMRDAQGTVVLGDFGTGRLSADDAEGVAGTPLYLAPEVLNGESASERSDIYSLGVLLFHLATGTYPVVARSITGIRDAHREAKRQALTALRTDLNRSLATAIERAVAPDPNDRWDSAEAMGAALEPPPALTLPFWRSHPLAVAAAAIALTVAMAGFAWMRSPLDGNPSAPIVALEDRPWVLLASSDNRTGNADLDGVLDYALERELIGSSQFRVASRARVDDILQLMRRPVDSRLDEAAAREVALRDGGIVTVIGGRLEAIGPTTVLSASVIDIASGAVVTQLSEGAATAAELPAAIRRLSNRLRAALGEAESSIRRTTQDLERVTTPSFKALRLYASESYAAGNREHWPAALSLAREAVAEDPAFAAAQTWLAWALVRNQLPSEQYLAAASKAVHLSGSASEWERLWIKASFHGLSGDTNQAQGAYEALVRLYPDHLWAVNNLVLIHRRANRDAEALPLAIRLAELRPRDYNSLSLVFDTYRRLGLLDQAAEYAHRIKANGAYGRGPSGDAWVFDAVLAWHHERPKDLIQELRKIEAEAPALGHELRDAVLARASMLWLAVGRPADAANALQQTTQTADASLARAAIALATGDLAATRREVLATKLLDVPAGGTNVGEAGQWALAMWLVGRSGAQRETRNLYAELEPNAVRRAPPQGPATANLLAAELARAEGRRPEVIRRLSPQNAWNNLRDPSNFRAAESLAEALVESGDTAAAAKALEYAMAQKHVGASDAAHWQLRCQVRLAELYQLLGRHDDAVKLANTLTQLLSEAEPGFLLASRVRAVLDSNIATNPAAGAAGRANVTTQSLRALRLYSAAANLMQGAPPWQDAGAEALLRDAVAADQGFASAHILLAYALNNLRRPRGEVLAEVDLARTLTGSTLESERMFINGSAHHLRALTSINESEGRQELAWAIPIYEGLVRIEPNHPWAADNLISIYQTLNRDADVLRVREQAARNRPLHLITQSWAAIELFLVGEFDRAAPYIARATGLTAALRDPENSFHFMWLSLAPAQRAWLANDPAKALLIVDQVAGQLGSLTPTGVRLSESARLNHSRQLVAMYLALGRLAQADRVAMAETSDQERRNLQAAVVAYRQDANGMGVLMPPNGAAASWLPLAVLPLPNVLFKSAPTPLIEPDRPALSDNGESILAARIALAHGETDAALALLRRARGRLSQRGIRRVMIISLLEAECLTARGEIQKAIGAIEVATLPRTATTFGASTGALWIHARARLAQLYRQAGRATDAQSVEAQLRTLLAVADDDHPIKRQLAGK